MKLEALQEALNSGMNTNVHKFYLPVKDETYNFKPLTVAQVKTLTKIFVDAEEKPFDIYEAICAMIKSMCIENLNMVNLSEYDRMKIMFEIFTANDMVADYKIKCSECDHENIVKPNNGKIIESMNKYKEQEIYFDNEGEDRLTCKIAVPSVKRLYNFYYLLQNKLVNSEDVFKCYIDDIEIHFSNNDVENIELSQGDDEKSLEEFIKNYEMLPAVLLKDKEKKSVDNYVVDIIDNMFSSQNDYHICEKCGAEIGGEAPASNFTL